MNQYIIGAFKILFIVILLQLGGCKEQHKRMDHSITIFFNKGVIQDEQKLDCSINLDDTSGTQVVKGAIEFRGSSSKYYPKRSYTVKFKNIKNVHWQGLSIMGDWVLYAPYADRSCIRNTIAEYLFKQMGHYSTSSVFTKLYINNEYMGLYELREKIDLDKPGLKDALGILKIDKTTGKKKQKAASFLSPDVNILEHDLAKGFTFETTFKSVQQFENALSDTTADINKFAVLNSLVDYFLFSEFANSPDAYRSSCYFQVNKEGRISMGPVWDYDLAFGNSTLYEGQNDKGWRYLISENKSPFYTEAPIWWSLLIKRTSFKKAAIHRWEQLRQNSFSNHRLNLLVDSITQSIQLSLEGNFNKWPVIGRQIQWAAPPQKSYQGELDYLKQWMVKRAQWMDEVLR